MKKLFSLTLSLLMLIACSLGTVSAFAAEGEEPAPVDLRDCTVTLQYASTTYTGKALRPSVKVQYNDIAPDPGAGLQGTVQRQYRLRHRPGEVDRHRRLYRRGEPQL